MKKFIVSMTKDVAIEVEAKDEDEAISKCCEVPDFQERVECVGWDIMRVAELDENDEEVHVTEF